MAAGCAIEGGCLTDYIAISISIFSFLLLLSWSSLPFLVHKVPRSKSSSFWLPAIQVLASFNLLLSIVISLNFMKFKRNHWWQSCYLWAGWIEGTFGFGLLLSCRLVQTFHLYYIFVRRRLPPIRSYALLPSILLPWVVVETLIHIKKPLNHHCHMRNRWIIIIVSLHGLYIVGLITFTRAIHHVEFRFHELKDLWRGILVSSSSIGIWVVAYVLNEIYEEITWLQVASRFLLLVMTSIFVLAFFSISISQPLLSQMSLRRREHREFKTMGQVLGVPDSGLLLPRESTLQIDPHEQLDKLLQNRSFRQSFMQFADRYSIFLLCLVCCLFYILCCSCLAGESVHFYNEVHELDKIPVEDIVRRIYMARHIIEKFVVAGAAMEVNLSHKSRQEILKTADLTDPDLFKNAVNELVRLMQMNLLRDYWSSMYFLKFKEEDAMRRVGSNLEQMNSWIFSPRLSSVRGSDDPFQIEVTSTEVMK